jgi:glycosyltransferase involved in cell wall biosynthesis
MKKLSIIIPCYNCEKTLEEAVYSCFTQGFSEREFEIIMVDDGSTDSTRNLIKKISFKYTNVQYIFSDINRGGGNTRNTAISNSNCEIIFCLDSDDILPPNTLIKMREYLIKKQCDGVAFNFSIKFNNRNINDIHHIDTFPYVDERIPFESLIDNSGLLCPLHVVFMFTKIAFDKAGGYPTNHGFDTQGFAWRFLRANLTAYTCPDTKYLHRINFHKSYYLRDAKNGLVNYNWQKILIENFDLFSDNAQKLIQSFNYSDFTRNIFSELKNMKDVLRSDYKSKLGKINQNQNILIKETKPIKQNSIFGIFLRIKFRLRNIVNYD